VEEAVKAGAEGPGPDPKKPFESFDPNAAHNRDPLEEHRTRGLI
jgi:hypothetical protein